MSEDKQYDFYVAGPFFDPEQTASMERLEKILEDHGKVLFKPRFVSQIEEAGPEGCFADDIRGVNAAKAVVANLLSFVPYRNMNSLVSECRQDAVEQIFVDRFC